MKIQLVTAAALILGLAATPVRADDEQPLQIKRCNAFCAFWRTVSGKAHVSFDGPIPSEVRHDRPAPRAEEGAYAPRPDELVAVHGEVIRKTAADRAEEKRQLARMMNLKSEVGENVAARQAARKERASQ